MTANPIESNLAAFRLTSAEAAGLPCRDRDVDPELFFPIAAADTPIYEKQVAEAKAVCANGCAIVAACLSRALVAGLEDGIYGGTTPEERRVMRQQPGVIEGAKGVLGEAVLSKLDLRPLTERIEAEDAQIVADRKRYGEPTGELPASDLLPAWAFDPNLRLRKPPVGKNRR